MRFKRSPNECVQVECIRESAKKPKANSVANFEAAKGRELTPDR